MPNFTHHHGQPSSLVVTRSSRDSKLWLPRRSSPVLQTSASQLKRDSSGEGPKLRAESGKREEKGPQDTGSIWACAQGFVEKEQSEERSWTKGQRKQGVKREKRRSEIKKSTKILLTRI